jgi:hypothetical protein
MKTIKRNPNMPAGAYTGPWHCVNTVTGESAQSEWSEERALYCCNILNEHNAKNGHAARFIVQRETQGEE